MMDEMQSNVAPLRWEGDRWDGHLAMLDQRKLPGEELWLKLHSADDVAQAIENMVIRGAPAIGIAAAYGFAIGMRNYSYDPMIGIESQAANLVERLMDTRPTAVNLRWALDRCRALTEGFQGDLRDLVEELFDEAEAIFAEDRENNRKLARQGAELFGCHCRVLTHCNTGGLATGGFGTALGVVRALDHQGKLEKLWIDETRPYLQGARLTTWECLKDGIEATLITDNMAAHFMAQGKVDAVVVGTDRVAANGDVANKIGTYGLAVCCAYHDIPFYVASPVSTIDLETPTGEDIPIEERSTREVTHVGDVALAPEGFDVAHPAFDVTPAALVTAIITEKGVVGAGDVTEVVG